MFKAILAVVDAGWGWGWGRDIPRKFKPLTNDINVMWQWHSVGEDCKSLLAFIADSNTIIINN